MAGSRVRAPWMLLLALALPALPHVARADPNDYVLTMDYTGGQREIETKVGGATSARNGTAAGEAAALAYGQGVSDAWFSEVYIQFANSRLGAQGGGLEALSWENVIRFSEPGQWPIDVGATVEVEKPRAGSQGWKVSAGPLLQKDFDQIQVNANLLLARSFNAGEGELTQLSYQFQMRYRSDPRLDFGMQALGDMGAWNHWGRPGGQAHRLGPAIFGGQHLGAGRSLEYNVALLMGVSRAAADATLRAQVDVEF